MLGGTAMIVSSFNLSPDPSNQGCTICPPGRGSSCHDYPPGDVHCHPAYQPLVYAGAVVLTAGSIPAFIALLEFRKSHSQAASQQQQLRSAAAGGAVAASATARGAVV
jgi:hypothetical protein